MKIRRSLALAAATAAITPAVLLAAPAAFATDSPTPTVAETTEGGSTGAGEEPGATNEEPAGTDNQTTETDGQPKGTDGQATDDNKESDGTVAESDTTEGGSGSKDEGTPTDKEPTPGTPSTSTTASPSPDPEMCTDTEDEKYDENLRTSLSGLPSKIVAGSGFHNFKLNVKNTGDNAYKRVDLAVFALLIDDKNFSDTTSHLTLQFKDPSTGQWVNISLNMNDEGAFYLGYTDVRPKETFSIDLRLSVDKKAPAGMGVVVSAGAYADDKGNCVSADEDFYQFDVLAAGSKPGTPGDAKPQGGRKPLPAKPVGDNEIVPQGHLAETGSSSALPMIALAGGAAVAVGAGAVFVVRRRKAGSGAATA
ncbi:LAETG motif-containing sortase-dependent surface protein [Streptomyces sp. NPDC088353]|uniref:LAETG motif-containing sortase-dependent surface protein n=1 Tax=unclassified Streptomyces TaxID=2593676 RepID=UPI0036866157